MISFVTECDHQRYKMAGFVFVFLFFPGSKTKKKKKKDGNN
jgi:hypothetical protein